MGCGGTSHPGCRGCCGPQNVATTAASATTVADAASTATQPAEMTANECCDGADCGRDPGRPERARNQADCCAGGLCSSSSASGSGNAGACCSGRPAAAGCGESGGHAPDSCCGSGDHAHDGCCGSGDHAHDSCRGSGAGHHNHDSHETGVEDECCSTDSPCVCDGM